MHGKAGASTVEAPVFVILILAAALLLTELSYRKEKDNDTEELKKIKKMIEELKKDKKP